MDSRRRRTFQLCDLVASLTRFDFAQWFKAKPQFGKEINTYRMPGTPSDFKQNFDEVAGVSAGSVTTVTILRPCRYGCLLERLSKESEKTGSTRSDHW